MSTYPLGNPDPQRLARVIQVLEVLDQIDQTITETRVVTCRECSTVLPDDTLCPDTEDGQHDPDQVTWEPGDGEPQTREIALALSVHVPNDGYDYTVDVTGRLELILSLILLHPLISRATTRGRTGSGYAGEITESS